MTYQQTIILGNVGRDPEMRYLQNGVAVCDFSVAVNKRYTANGERKEETTWFRVTCWRQLAETVNQYVRRGKQVMVVGEVSVYAYLDKSGQPAASLQLTASDVRFVGTREGGGEYNSNDPSREFAPPGQMDDIPF
jgi:single-strand DNA-binding protein